MGLVLLVTAGSSVGPSSQSSTAQRGLVLWLHGSEQAALPSPVSGCEASFGSVPGRSLPGRCWGCQQCRDLGERGSPGKGRGDGEEGKDRGGWERRQERERQGGRGRRGKIRGKRSTRGGEKKDGLGGRETHT